MLQDLVSSNEMGSFTDYRHHQDVEVKTLLLNSLFALAVQETGDGGGPQDPQGWAYEEDQNSTEDPPAILLADSVQRCCRLLPIMQ